MKIEINESASSTPDFPAFYKDKDGDLWFWVDRGSAVCISSPSVYENNDYLEVDFSDFDYEHNFVRVHGTITITV